ncbi:hypothetical protein ABN034_20620 [Actinopolymorpha sp. B11F2]|uniref:hypothetical protein n=1 Tax=Actinopolymorpha sp. B11F2 TaxID=3160862 RepID=UPI0032E4621B
MTTNPDSGSSAVGMPAGQPAGRSTANPPPGIAGLPPERPAPADDNDVRTVPDDATQDEPGADLPWDEATAYGVEGFDPDDPWNAVLCVESDRSVTLLPLTPRSLDHLVGSLGEVREAQRLALGMSASGDEGDVVQQARHGAFRQVAHAAQLATGSAPVSQLWQTSTRGRLIIIGGAGLFVALGIIASLFAR